MARADLVTCRGTLRGVARGLDFHPQRRSFGSVFCPQRIPARLALQGSVTLHQGTHSGLAQDRVATGLGGDSRPSVTRWRPSPPSPPNPPTPAPPLCRRLSPQIQRVIQKFRQFRDPGRRSAAWTGLTFPREAAHGPVLGPAQAGTRVSLLPSRCRSWSLRERRIVDKTPVKAGGPRQRRLVARESDTSAVSQR